MFLNWKEDKYIFRRWGRGAVPKPIPDKYARWGRTTRVVILICWLVVDCSMSIYEKFLSCNIGKNEWCDTQTSYSSHIYGFLSGLQFQNAMVFIIQIQVSVYVYSLLNACLQ